MKWMNWNNISTNHHLTTLNDGGPRKPWNLFIKNCIFILTCVNVSHLLKYWAFDAMHLLGLFFCCSKQFWTGWFWCFLVLLPCFCFTCSILAKLFPLRIFFIWGNKKKKKVTLGETGWIERWSVGVILFLVRKFWTLSVVWAGVLVNRPSWSRQMRWKNLKKKFTEVECSLSQCQLVH